MVLFIIWRYCLRVPKIVDHEERRRSIARAFQDHVAEYGFAATTYARVAASAGISVGLIQHYFTDRHALLEYAYDDLVRRRDERIDDCVAAGEDARWSIRKIIDHAVRELLPLDDQRRREHRVARQLQLAGSQDPALAALAKNAHDALELRVRTAVRNGTECGEVDPAVDAEVAAIRLVSAVYGLADLIAVRAVPARVSKRQTYSDVLDPVLGTVFTGECRRHTQPPANHTTP